MLKRGLFDSLTEAKVLVEEYRKHHNERRPHSALGYQTPAEFAAKRASSAAKKDVARRGHEKELESVPALS